MNGEFTRELTEAGPFSASGRILNQSVNDEQIVENCFLTCLTRRPTDAEKQHFVGQFQDAPQHQRNEITQDLYWCLFNAPEFSWNH